MITEWYVSYIISRVWRSRCNILESNNTITIKGKPRIIFISENIFVFMPENITSAMYSNHPLKHYSFQGKWKKYQLKSDQLAALKFQKRLFAEGKRERRFLKKTCIEKTRHWHWEKEIGWQQRWKEFNNIKRNESWEKVLYDTFIPKIIRDTARKLAICLQLFWIERW